MAKFFIYADPHICTYSSIVRTRGSSYSTRLEHCIDSINWVQREAEANQCSAIICLGDFFDKESLNSEELSSLQSIQWSNTIQNIFLVGNHEMGLNSLEYSSTHVFSLCPNSLIIDKPQCLALSDNTNFLCIPYMLENKRKSLKEYLSICDSGKRTVIFSHNDLAGIRFGQYESKVGFSIDEIEESGAIFLNGHLHNSESIGKTGKIINIGNLTGQNFSENAFKYPHGGYIYDDDRNTLEFLSNPFALNFYKIDTTAADWDDNVLFNLKNNAVLTVKAFDNKIADYSMLLKTLPNIVESRLITVNQPDSEVTKNNSNAFKLNYFDKFIEFVYNNFERSPVIEEELGIICGGSCAD